MIKTIVRLFPLLVIIFGWTFFVSPATAATLTASPTTVGAGGSLTAAWSGISSPTGTDWIGLYVPGALNTAYLRFQYTNGAASGSAAYSVPAGTAAGTYELRLFANNGYTLLATSNSFTVTVPILSPSPPNATPGGITTVTWSGIAAPTATDWIALAVPGSANNVYVANRYTTGAASGSVPFAIPAGTALGTYELRLFANGGTGRLATTTVGVVGPLALSASPSSVAPGGSVTVSWSNILDPAANDWVGLYAAGAANSNYQSRVFTGGGSNGSLNFTIPAGTGSGSYELRLFSNNTYTRLTSSNSFTITGAATSLSASPSSMNPGGTLTATWSAIYSPTSSDWLALSKPGLADSVYQKLQYTGTITAAGTAPFVIPAGTGPGTYELRLFSNGTFTRLATSSTFTVGTATTDSISYIYPDHLDTPRVITNQAQQVVWRWDNDDPFGANMANANPSGLGTFAFNLRLPGQYFDAETNNHYNYFRDYSPETGRYIQGDPLGLTGGLNLYNYSEVDPVRKRDPLGLVPGGGPRVILPRPQGAASLGAGGSGNIGPGGLGAESGFAAGLNGNLCFYSTTCWLVGWNTIGGGALGIVGSIQTGPLCTGSQTSRGAYYFGGSGLGGEAQILYGGGGTSYGRGIGGIAAGAGAGYMECETEYRCLWTPPSCQQGGCSAK
jgi:RHS repeat-associated protein